MKFWKKVQDALGWFLQASLLFIGQLWDPWAGSWLSPHLPLVSYDFFYMCFWV